MEVTLTAFLKALLTLGASGGFSYGLYQCVTRILEAHEWNTLLRSEIKRGEEKIHQPGIEKFAVITATCFAILMVLLVVH